MKSIAHFLIVFAVSAGIACTTQQAASLVKGDRTPTPALEPEYIKNAQGEFIRKKGWDVPALPSDRKYQRATSRTRDREIVWYDSYYPGNGKLVLNELFTVLGSPRYGNVMSITEQADGNKKPFCYRIAATEITPPGVNGAGLLMIAYLRDEDGDGLFETLSGSCPVPRWASRWTPREN